MAVGGGLNRMESIGEVRRAGVGRLCLTITVGEAVQSGVSFRCLSLFFIFFRNGLSDQRYAVTVLIFRFGQRASIGWQDYIFGGRRSLVG